MQARLKPLNHSCYENSLCIFYTDRSNELCFRLRVLATQGLAMTPWDECRSLHFRHINSSPPTVIASPAQQGAAIQDLPLSSAKAGIQSCLAALISAKTIMNMAKIYLWVIVRLTEDDPTYDVQPCASKPRAKAASAAWREEWQKVRGDPVQVFSN